MRQRTHWSVGLLVLAVTLPTEALDTRIEYTGRITDETCSVQVASNSQRIDMGSFSVADFLSAGDVSPSRQFSIVLERCSLGIRAANVSFSGSINTDDRGLIALTQASGMATGLGIELLDFSGQRIVPGTPMRHVVQPGRVTLDYSLRYRATGATMAPGVANAVILFDVDYE